MLLCTLMVFPCFDFSQRCDLSCAVFGDCCFDAVKPDMHISMLDKYSFCVKPSWARYTVLPEYLGYKLIDKCPSDTTDRSLREKCDNNTLSSDTAPVTDTTTGLRFVYFVYYFFLVG